MILILRSDGAKPFYQATPPSEAPSCSTFGIHMILSSLALPLCIMNAKCVLASYLLHRLDSDRCALRRPTAVVEIVEIAAQTLIEDV